MKTVFHKSGGRQMYGSLLACYCWGLCAISLALSRPLCKTLFSPSNHSIYIFVKEDDN